MEDKVNKVVVQTKPDDEQIQQLLDLVPKGKKEKAHELLAVMVEQHSIYSGPLPPAEQFASYEKALPGSAERILSMAEKQQEHRISLEKIAVSKEMELNSRGQLFGFVAMFFLLALSVFFVMVDMKIWGGIVGSITIVLIISLFVGGKASIGKDLASKK